MRSAKVDYSTFRRFMQQANAQYVRAGFLDMQLQVRRDGSIDRAPSKPRAAHVVSGADGTNTLMWKPASDDHGRVFAYRIFRDGKFIATVKDSTWFTDAKATGQHDYEVRAVDESNMESMSAIMPMAGGASLTQAGMIAMQRETRATAATQAAAGQSGATGTTNAGTQAAAGAASAGSTKPAKVVGTAPQITGLDPVGSDGFKMTWQAVSGATSYGIYRNGTLIGHVSSPEFAATVAAGAPSTLQIDAVMQNGSRTPLTRALQTGIGSDGKVQFAVPGAAAAPAAANPSAAEAGAPRS